MHNLRYTTLRRRAPVLALFAMAVVLWATASAAACTTGYFHFTNSMKYATNAVQY